MQIDKQFDRWEKVRIALNCLVVRLATTAATHAFYVYGGRLMADLEHWTMWRERCALALCTCDAREDLHGFAFSRYRHYAGACSRIANAPSPAALTPRPAEAWHWFETHLRVSNTKAGKSYKQWLFARADATHDKSAAIDGGATLLMRDVVRERLRREFSPRGTASFDAPVNVDDPDSPTLHDLLPSTLDTRETVAMRELESLAEASADDLFQAISRRERLALLANTLNLAPTDNRLLHIADCARTSMMEALGLALRRIADHARNRHPHEDRQTIAILASILLQSINARVEDWGRSLKTCQCLFPGVEESGAA